MELYLGGAGNGKLQYVIQKSSQNNTDLMIADGAVATDTEIMQAAILNHLHLWIRNNLEDAEQLAERLTRIIDKNPDLRIICDEVGCGIVPMDAVDRQYRELTGRICCRLAEQATVVERILFGIGQRLK